MVFQENALFDSLTVAENVGYRLFEEGEMREEQALARAIAPRPELLPTGGFSSKATQQHCSHQAIGTSATICSRRCRHGSESRVTESCAGSWRFSLSLTASFT